MYNLKMLGALYIIATPIGNLEDMTLRALRVLREVDLILAEDTRVTEKLLIHYDIDKDIMSYHHYSNISRKTQIYTDIIAGKNIALVTDAGTPGISDPGNELIDFLLDRDKTIKIVPIPGASAITTALSVSGFRADKFVFLGFLPKKKRKKLFEWIKEGKITFAFYESPYRIFQTLAVLEEYFGKDRRIFIARELTKLHETLYRGKLSEVRSQIEKEKVRGEITAVVEGT